MNVYELTLTLTACPPHPHPTPRAPHLSPHTATLSEVLCVCKLTPDPLTPMLHMGGLSPTVAGDCKLGMLVTHNLRVLAVALGHGHTLPESAGCGTGSWSHIT